MASLGALVVVASTCLGQSAGEAPALPDEIAKELEYFVGEWAVEGRASKGPLKGRWIVKWAPARQCLLVDYPLSVGDESSRGTGLWGWDASTKEMFWVAFYSRGAVETTREKVKAPGVYQGTYAIVLNGKRFEGRIESRRAGPNEWTVKTKGLGTAEEGIADLSVRFTRVTKGAKRRK